MSVLVVVPLGVADTLARVGAELATRVGARVAGVLPVARVRAAYAVRIRVRVRVRLGHLVARGGVVVGQVLLRRVHLADDVVIRVVVTVAGTGVVVAVL